MKKFTFSLQYLLNVHKTREQAAKEALMQALKDHADAERHVLAVKEHCKAQMGVIERMQGGVIKRSDYSRYVRSVNDLHKRIHELESAADKLLTKVDEQRDGLRKVMMDRRIMEKLGDQERLEWEEMARQEERKIMDEVAAGRWVRRGDT